MLQSSTSSDSNKNIQVAIKVRPVLKGEKEAELASYWKTTYNSIQSIDNSSRFCFDYIFGENDSNKIIFEKIAKPIVDASLKGFNGTILAYGQISSGKTFTMLGDEKNLGIMCLVAKEIFQKIVTLSNREFLLRVGYFEIYNEEIYDLLNESNKDLKIHGDVVNCAEFVVRSEDEMMKFLYAGSKLRKYDETSMNERSSLSHAIFRLIIESRNTIKINDDDAIQISNLNLVNLAGARLAESGLIKDCDLLSLSCVIESLNTNTSGQCINYDGTKLTRILKASLSGNALAAFICTINPTAIKGTISTLNFAMGAKTIINNPYVNKMLNDTAMMKYLDKEICRLKTELEIEEHKNNKEIVLELENQIRENNSKIVNCLSIGKLKKSSKRRSWQVQTIPEEETIQQEPTELQISDIEKEQNGVLIDQLINVYDEEANSDFRFDYDPESNENLVNVNFPFLRVSKLKNSDWNLPENFPFGWNQGRGISAKPKSLLPEPKSLIPEPKSLIPEPKSLIPKSKFIKSIPSYNSDYNNIELEFEELKNFTNLEKVLEVEFDPLKSLSERLNSANDLIDSYKKEKTILMYEKEILLEDFRITSKELEENVQKVKAVEGINLDLKQNITVLQKKNAELQMQANILVGKEMDYKKSNKNLVLRTEELLDHIEEKELENGTLKCLIESMKSVKCENCLNHENKILSLDQSLQLKENEIKNSNNVRHDLEKQLVQLQAEYDKVFAQLIESSIEKYGDGLKNVIKKNRIDFSDKINQTEQEDNEIEKNYCNSDISEIYKQSLENFSDLNDNNNILKQTVSLFQEQNSNYLNQIKDLNNKMLLNDDTLKDLQNQNVQNESSNLKLNNDLQKLRNLVQSLQNELNGQSTNFEPNETSDNDHELIKKQKDLIVIEKKYSELQILYTNVENDNKLLKESNIENEKIVFGHIKKLSALENDNKQLQNKYDDLHSKFNDTQNKLILKLKDLDEITSKFSELQFLFANVEKCNILLKEKNDIYQKIVVGHTEKLSALEKDKKQLQNKYDDLGAKFNDTENRLILKQKSLDILEKKFTKLQLSHTNIENDNKLLKESYIENEKIVFGHIEKLTALENDYKQLQKKYDDLHTKFNDTENKLILKQKDFDKMEKKFAKLKLLHTNVGKDNKQLKERNIENENHAEKLSALEKDKKQLQNKYDDLRAKFGDTENKLILKQKDLDKMEKKFAKLQLLCSSNENNKKLSEENEEQNNKGQSKLQCDLKNSEMQNNYLEATRSTFQKGRKSKRQTIHDGSRELLTDPTSIF